ncbi:MAG: hypothetical protein R6X02_29845 [Enhygromyxa sp.]
MDQGDQGDPGTHWIDGRIVDDEPRPAGSAWAYMAAVLVLLLAVDLALAWGRGQTSVAAAEEPEAVDLRERLVAAATAASEGRPAFVLVGDSVLAGDVMAPTVPDWASQRVIDHMRRELAVDSDALLQQIAFDALLPVDALHVLAELDRIDPAGEVRFVFELNLRYFSRHYAEQRGCTRSELCELGRAQLAGAKVLAQAGAGLLESAGLIREQLHRWAPVHRHRPQLERLELAALEGLAVTRPTPTSTPKGAAPRSAAESLARVGAHYREVLFDPEHAQVEALIAIVDRLRARGRPAALFFTPLEDQFTAATLPGTALGRHHERIAALIHDRGLAQPGSGRRPKLDLLDLDHPLFGSRYFLDHVHLDPEGNRLLALNLLHELGLPLRERPFEWMMVHSEDHDRSLVHRRGLGFADGGAWGALFHDPEGVAVSRSGDWIVIADTRNHVLRQLRGSMQIVERLAGTPRRSGHLDKLAPAARLERPRSPEILGDAVYFLDGAEGSRVRALTGLAHGAVKTLRWSGPRCDAYDELEAGVVEGRAMLMLLCADDRVLLVDPHARAASLIFDPKRGGEIEGVRGLEPTPDGRLLLADDRSRIWSISLVDRRRPPELLFANTAAELLPGELEASYPYGFEQMRLNRIVGMEWVERYGALLVQDEHDLGRDHKRLRREQTERVHLRLLDFDAGLIYPWIKAIPHAEAFHLWNETSRNLVSYYHLGAMAVVQDDASLVYLERTRSRLVRIADGLLAASKAGGLRTETSKVELLQPIDTASAGEISATFRPDRQLGTRHEPIPRRGPYVALLLGSSLSSISDRFGNYSLGRLLERELQAELGYRDGVRLDLYQRTFPATYQERFVPAGCATAGRRRDHFRPSRVRLPDECRHSLAAYADALEQFSSLAGPAPDIVLFELHDRQLEARDDRLAQLRRIERLAARHDTLVIFYDNSALAADGRDGLRATRPEIEQLITDIRELGFLLLEPSDRLLRELLVESPWGNQPWGEGRRHGSTWAIELTARVLASSAYPAVREYLRGRTPARERLSERQAEGR